MDKNNMGVKSAVSSQQSAVSSQQSAVSSQQSAVSKTRISRAERKRLKEEKLQVEAAEIESLRRRVNTALTNPIPKRILNGSIQDVQDFKAKVESIVKRKDCKTKHPLEKAWATCIEIFC